MDLSAQEVDTIAAALPYAQSLTAIDCRQNASMGEEAASRLVDLIGSNTAPIRSFCGVGGSSSSLTIPRDGNDRVDLILIAAELESSTWSESVSAEQVTQCPNE